MGWCRVALALTFVGVLPLEGWSKPRDEICVYYQANGSAVQVVGRANVPPSLREKATCFSTKERTVAATQLAAPDQIHLDGTVRKDDIATSLGRIEMRWPRSAETLFGRTPLRAVTEAAGAVSRALKTGGFDARVQQLTLPWKIVFMDEKLPEGQIPLELVSNCHPGWMTPPANIYIVAQRVAAGCGGERRSHQSVADAQLAQVLIHEMGHAVEYALLGDAATPDRMRAEGFACWFEQYGTDFSPLMRKGATREYYLDLAKQSLRSGEQILSFSGSAFDYARASLLFHAIAERRGVPGLMRVYKAMRESHHAFIPAVEVALGWDEKKLVGEARWVVTP